MDRPKRVALYARVPTDDPDDRLQVETQFIILRDVQRQLYLPVPSIILAGPPPVPDPAAGPLRCGSWARRIPG